MTTVAACRTCGAEPLEDALFCHSCGSRLDSAGTHPEYKQVTVLFADVVGFRTLAERLDPEAVHTIMDGCFDVLTRCAHRYEGSTNERGH